MRGGARPPEPSQGRLSTVSVDTSVASALRNPDGSLPPSDPFRLAKGSKLIDAGTKVGLPFSGTLPDLGAFESTQ
jgi:hypothetical protein